MEMKKKLDVLIIGSGGAGCAAAFEAWRLTKNILIVSKGELDDSKTARAQGGIQAAILEKDSPELHFEDTLRAGNYKNNKSLVSILTKNARDTIAWLEQGGVEFDKEVNGTYKLKSAAGLSNPRVLSCGDESGNKIIRPLLSKLLKLKIPIVKNCGVSRIEKKGNLFFSTIHTDDCSYQIQSKTVILATGGIIPREKRFGLRQKKQIPDGIALAEMLKAEIVQPNLMQYHPTGIISPKPMRRMRLPETMRACGAKLLNKNMEKFVDPLLTRNKLTQAIVKTCELGEGIETEDGYIGVWMTTPDIDKKMGIGYTSKNYPKFYHTFLKFGIDITKVPVLVYPIVHYSLGGVEINEHTESSVSGLYAVGETAYGVHGEDRLMGNSLLDIFVFGRIAGRNASKKALQIKL